MREIRTEGIILSCNWLREGHLLLRIFTPLEGIVICSISSKKNALPSPLSRVEIILKQKQEGFFRCEELHEISLYLPLRKNFSLLQSASRLLTSIEASQWKHHPSQELYKLLISYLDKMMAGFSAEILCVSFVLKLLKYEGIWDPFFVEVPIGFSQEEADILLFLTEVKSYQQLGLVSLSMDLQKKIMKFFEDCLEN